jgi:phenylacetate-coenzyme A ligase PaaK-like adenylate-forming protein
MAPDFLVNQIFSIKTDEDFNQLSIAVFKYQFENNQIYKTFCQSLGIAPSDISNYRKIPFLPIELFKNHAIISNKIKPELVFSSSGTTGVKTSRHYVVDPSIYEKSFTLGFQQFFGKPSDYHILALLPGYMERTGSSLIYMVKRLIDQSNSHYSDFYLDELSKLRNTILKLHDRKILLIGVSFALLELAENNPFQHPNLIVMETGGMKGRRKELIREELHEILSLSFGVEKICSEYGMTELLSQAYSLGNGVFETPPWMKVLIGETNDPFYLCPANISGCINVIDLANIYSCSFIATQDLGKCYDNGNFEVTGRFDNSDIRGCNLLI